MTITHLVTHSGGFHADELLSTAILTRLHPDATLIRTRDPAWITPGPGKIIYDVGRGYDPERGLFDHHQRPMPCRDDGTPLSSFGLIWKHFGHDYMRATGIPDDHLDEIHAGFDHSFVRPIDVLDNGAMEPSVAGPLAGMTLPVLLETLKPAFDDDTPDADTRAFEQALAIARSVIEASLRNMAAKQRAATMVNAAIAKAGSSPVLELSRGMPFRGAIEKAGADHLLFVIHPRDTDWALTTIRKGADTFESRADLPAAWAGLTDAALEDASGVRGAKFCHNGLFLAVASDREAILAMADCAVKGAIGADA